MPVRVRVWMFIAGLASVFVLVLLLIYAPPDGLERAEVAQFLGRFHPLIVHLPIALLLLVPILECAGFVQEHLRQAVGFVLVIAVAAVIAAAGFGWLLAWSGGFEGPLVTRHMWGGVSLAATSLACWGLYRVKPRMYVAALLLTIGLLIWTSDQGGKLTHGANFLTERMPQIQSLVWRGTKGLCRPHQFLCHASAADLRPEVRSLSQYRKVQRQASPRQLRTCNARRQRWSCDCPERSTQE